MRLAAVYQPRPFVVEELWAGQIARLCASWAVGRYEKEMYDGLVAMTGLDEERLRRAVARQNGHDRPSGQGLR
ncbi:hypothetical protein [Kitasatospora sp. MBT63]|uniref:hypothetical protein n=1 Tax=Kitasatospora sp. MBT63 TaxID=1444768 RepID=UPI00068D69E3|nr:hypothetical protein [Kitasatospora sp. MBT63]